MYIKNASEYINKGLAKSKWDEISIEEKEQYLFTAQSIIDGISNKNNRNYERAIYEQIVYMLMFGVSLQDINSASVDGSSISYKGTSYISPIAKNLLGKKRKVSNLR